MIYYLYFKNDLAFDSDSKLSVPCFMNYTHYFIKFRPATFLPGKKLNFTFIHAKKVFFNVVFNGKKVGRKNT